MTVNEWRKHLDSWGLVQVAGLGLELLEPLSPLVGQVLWVAQPTLGLMINRQHIAEWAAFWEDPQTVAEFKEQLLNTHE